MFIYIGFLKNNEKITLQSLSNYIENSKIASLKELLTSKGFVVDEFKLREAIKTYNFEKSNGNIDYSIAKLLSTCIEYTQDSGYILYVELQHMGFSKAVATKVRADIETKRVLNDYNGTINSLITTAQRLATTAIFDGGIGIEIKDLKNKSLDELYPISEAYLKEMLNKTNLKLTKEEYENILDVFTVSLKQVINYQETLTTSNVDNLSNLRNGKGETVIIDGVEILDGSGFQGFYHGVGLLASADVADIAVASSITATGKDKTTISTSYISEGHYDVVSQTGIIVEGNLIAMNAFDSQFFTRISSDEISAFLFNNGTSTINGLTKQYGTTTTNLYKFLNFYQCFSCCGR